VRSTSIPGEPGTAIVREQVTQGSIPKEFITTRSIEGIKEALTRGVLAGYPVDDVRIGYDGSY
jgi:elongation factor G